MNYPDWRTFANRNPPEDSGKTAGATELFAPSGEQQNLVIRLQEYLLSDDNLSNTDINRDDIISALGTNKNTLTDAVKAVTGKSPMEYMRTLKVEEARRKLDSHPELTIEAIAFSCGFNIPSTFIVCSANNMALARQNTGKWQRPKKNKKYWLQNSKAR